MSGTVNKEGNKPRDNHRVVLRMQAGPVLKKCSDRVPPEMVAFRLGIIRGWLMAAQEKKGGKKLWCKWPDGQ